MRLLIVSAIFAALNLLPPIAGVEASYQQYVLLLFFSLYLLGELFVALILGEREEQGDGQRATGALQEQLATVEEELKRVRGELQHSREQCATAEARVQELEAQTVLEERPERINAELVNLLSVLQDKGRFIDFVMADISRFGDAQIGAAARVVHQGCAAVAKEYFEIVPVVEGKEGEQITIPRGYDSRAFRLLGKIAGEPPFTGKLLHQGWRTHKVTVPRVVIQENGAPVVDILAPAEVELG